MVAGNPFVIEKDTRILYLEDNILLERNTQFLAGYIKEATGRRLKVESGQDVNDKNMITSSIFQFKKMRKNIPEELWQMSEQRELYVV